MQHLHAYWRMEYVEAPKRNSDCRDLFLNLPQSGDDREALILFRGVHCYAVLNRFPYNAGHTLVVPYRKVASPAELSADERVEFFDTIIRMQEVLTSAIRPDGFNIGINLGKAAGAGIPEHLHCHVVPRWAGDTNFMPVTGNTRVLPTALESMWERLKSCL